MLRFEMRKLPSRVRSVGARLASLFLGALTLLGLAPAPTQAEPTISDRVAAVRTELRKTPAGLDQHGQPPELVATDEVNAAQWGNWGNWANFSNWGNWGNWFNA
jgi:hypothetical protein